MHASVYNRREWRELPRDGECAVRWLLGELAGECSGPIHRHHVNPLDPGSRSIQVCESHHPSLQAVARRLQRPRQRPWRRCRHVHRYPGARAECERRLNTAA